VVSGAETLSYALNLSVQHCGLCAVRLAYGKGFPGALSQQASTPSLALLKLTTLAVGTNVSTRESAAIMRELATNGQTTTAASTTTDLCGRATAMLRRRELFVVRYPLCAMREGCSLTMIELTCN
jgi:hypothetical protein